MLPYGIGGRPAIRVGLPGIGGVVANDVAVEPFLAQVGARRAVVSDPVQQWMACPVTTLSQDEGIFQATQYMMENTQRRLPVVDSLGRLVGLVSLDDLLVLLSRELDNLAQGVEAEIAPPA